MELGDILEYEQVYNDYYDGSPADIFTDGSIKIMEMDLKGHRIYREAYMIVRHCIRISRPSLAGRNKNGY